jgi:hypothetical protein
MTPALDCFALSTGTFVVRRGRVRREDGKSYSVEWMLGVSISFLYFFAESGLQHLQGFIVGRVKGFVTFFGVDVDSGT